MKIRNRLQLITLIVFIVAVTVAVVSIAANRHLAQEQAQIENVQATLEALFRLRGRTFKYLMQPGARVVAQWRAEQEEIGSRLQRLAGATPEEQLIAGSLRQDNERSKAIFDQLAALGAEAERAGGREIISGQLQLKIESVASGVLRLGDSMRRRLAAEQQRAALAITALMAVLVLITAAGLLLLGRSILRPLDALRKGAEIIGTGNLEYRLGLTSRDEIGELAGAFEQMTESLQRTRAELTQAGSNARSLIEAILDPLVTISPDGKVADVNQATERVTGRGRGDLIGTDFSDYFTEPVKAREGYQRVLREGSVTDYPLAIRHQDGHLTDVLYNASLYRDQAGKVMGVFAVARDVTGRKRAETLMRERMKELQAFYHLSELAERKDLSLDGLYQELANLLPNSWQYPEVTCARIVVGDREFRTANFRMSEWMLVAPFKVFEAAIGKIEVGYLEQKPKEDEGPFFREERLLIDAIAERIGHITERRRAEEELRKYHEHLEELVRERTSLLEAANQELEGFAYSVSHDLRVPLRAIDGFSQQVLKRYEDKLDDEGKRYLNLVRDNTKKMSQLIDDILAFSRMGRLGMSVSEIDMDAIAHAVVEELKPSFAGRELALEIKPLPSCRGDQAMLRQVWINLLGNAIKFTRTKPDARVEVGGRIEGADNIYYVKDNGAGFDMQYADKLFGVFQRLHGVEEFEGTGIGLAIVKRIVTRHGGRVWAEGRVNEGAAFYFALPGQIGSAT